MGAVYICECTDPKSQHKRERFGCRAPGCECTQFEADMKASAAAQGAELATGGVVAGPIPSLSSGCVIDPVEVVVPDWEKPFLLTDDELRAALAKAEQERDEALSYLGPLRESLKAGAANAYEAMRERDEAQAELASARQEIGVLRAERTDDVASREEEARALIADNGRLERELAEVRSAAARQWIVARDGGRDCERCDQEIRRGEAYELLDGVDELRHIHCPRAELYAYDAWSCLTEGGCGSRYTVPDPDHRCGPLTAVRVAITHREEEPTA